MNATVDAAPFEAALVNLYPRLLRCAERLSGNRAEAQDLVQDALERGLRRRGLFRTGGAPDRWMTTILRRIFLDRCRSARRLAETHANASVLAGDGSEPMVEPRASELFDAVDLRHAVAQLESPFREVYTLYAFESLSHREIGRRLAMPTSTVGTRVLRARQRLRAIMDGTDAPGGPPAVSPAPPPAADEAGYLPPSLTIAPPALSV